MIKNKTFLSATIASIAVLASATAALATPVAATRGVNVRSGPGTNFSILDTLRGGEFAEAVECVQSGWCRVEHDGPSGWVYNTYLGPRPGAQNNQGNNQGGNPAQPAPQQNDQAGACFYTEQGHQGDEYCSGLETYNTLGGFNNRIRSYKVFGGAHVNFCVEENMAGACYEGSRTTPTLGGPLDRQASSLSVFTVDGNNNNGGGFNLPAQQPPANTPPAQQNPPANNPPANNPPANNSNDSDCSFAIVLGPNGPTASLTCGDNAVLPPPANGNNNQGNNAGNNNDNGPVLGEAIAIDPPQDNQGQLNEPPLPPEPNRGNLACFYEQENYQGTEFCGEPGFIASELQAYNDRFKSVKLWGTARAKICQHEGLEGVCEIISESKPRLSNALWSAGSSLRIFTGNAIPVVTARNIVTLTSGQYANVDASNAGVVSNGITSASDFVYSQSSGVESAFFGVNDAKIGFGYGPERGYEGCLAADYSNPSVTFRPQINQHFCIKTEKGRISELRVEGYPSGKIIFSYQTWGR